MSSGYCEYVIHYDRKKKVWFWKLNSYCKTLHKSADFQSMRFCMTNVLNFKKYATHGIIRASKEGYSYLALAGKDRA